MSATMKFEKLISNLIYLLVFSSPLSIDVLLNGNSLGLTVLSEPLCLVTSSVVLLLGLYKIKEKEIQLNYLDVVVLMHLTALVVTSLFSWNTFISLKYTFIISSYIFSTYFGFKLLSNKEKVIERLTYSYLIGHFVLATYCFYNFIKLGIFYETSYIVAQPFVMQGHSNLSILLEAPTILASVLLLNKKLSKTIKALLLINVFIFIAVISFSCSRTSYITLFLSFVALFFFSLTGDTKRKLLIYAGGPFILMLGIWKANDLIHYYQYKDDPTSYYNSESLNYDSNDIRTYKQTNMWDEMWEISETENRAGKSSAERIYRWVKGWQLWEVHPMTGIGPGTFADRYLEVYKNSSNEYERFLAERKMNIHNLYLSWLFEGGVIVFITGVGLILFIIQTGLLLIKNDAPSIHKALAVSFIPFIIHSLVQDYWTEPRVAVSFWIGLAVLNYFSSNEVKSNYQ